jgi:hypothetical protein
MKAVTIAKIARLIVIFSILIVLAIPAFAGVESFKVTKGDFVGTDSVYEMKYMTTSDLSSNIKDVVDDREGYRISYGKVMSREVDPADIDSLAAEIKAAIPDGKATLMDPEGKICKQQTIMGSSETEYKQYIFTGLKLTGSMVNMVKLSGTLDSVINGVKNVISPIRITPNGDSYTLMIEVPYLLFATALAAGNDAKVGLSLGIEYNSFFTMEMSLALPIKDFTGGTEIPVSYDVKKDTTYTGSDHTYDGLEIKQELDIDASKFSGIEGFSSINASIGNFGSGEGGIRLEVDDEGKVKVMADKENLIDAFNSARNEDGSLDINVEGESQPIHIEKSDLDSLLSMSDELIKMAQDQGIL